MLKAGRAIPGESLDQYFERRRREVDEYLATARPEIREGAELIARRGVRYISRLSPFLSKGMPAVLGMNLRDERKSQRLAAHRAGSGNPEDIQAMLSLYEERWRAGQPIDRRLSQAFTETMLAAWRSGKLPAKKRGRKKDAQGVVERQRRAVQLVDKLAAECATLTAAYELAMGPTYRVPYSERTLQRLRRRSSSLGLFGEYWSVAEPMLKSLGILKAARSDVIESGAATRIPAN